MKIFLYVLLIAYSISAPFTVPFTTKNQQFILPKVNSFLEVPTAQVTTNNEFRECINMCFGTPPQCFELEIHGSSFYMWMFDDNYAEPERKAFNIRKSSTFEKAGKNIVIDYPEDKNVYGYYAKDDIYINNNKNKLFRANFVLAQKTDAFTKTVGLIGLGYTPKSYEEEFSFIEQLYQQRIISHKVFTQSFINDINGEISFGKIPDKIVTDYKHYGRCAALDWFRQEKKFKNSYWQCQLNGVYFGKEYNPEKVKKISDNVSFFSYRPLALVPLEFFNYLEQTYFKELIASGKCSKKNYKNLDIFACKEDIKYSEELELTFVFGYWGMRIPFDKLFQYKKSREQYEFVLYHQSNFEKFTLGRPLVKNYLMVYDTHNAQVGFYDKDNVFYLHDSEPPKVNLHEYEPEDAPIKPKNETKNSTIGGDFIKPIRDIIDKKKINIKVAKDEQYLQKCFLYFSITVLAVIFIFAVYLFIRNRRKKNFPGYEYFIEQSKKLEGYKLQNF